MLANLVGGYVIGMAMALFATRPELSPAGRLIDITDLLSSLTTASTSSAEVVSALRSGRLGCAAGIVATHVLGDSALTQLGMATPSLLQRAG